MLGLSSKTTNFSYSSIIEAEIGMDFSDGMTVSPKKMGIKIEPHHFRKRKTYYTSPGHLRSTTAWMKNFPALKSAY